MYNSKITHCWPLLSSVGNFAVLDTGICWYFQRSQRERGTQLPLNVSGIWISNELRLLWKFYPNISIVCTTCSWVSRHLTFWVKYNLHRRTPFFYSWVTSHLCAVYIKNSPDYTKLVYAEILRVFCLIQKNRIFLQAMVQHWMGYMVPECLH